MQKQNRSSSPQDAARRYAGYRQEARDAVQALMADITSEPVTLSEINFSALEQAKTWWFGYANANRVTHAPYWNWEKLLSRYRRRPKHIELAIWVSPTLCGLAIGYVSRHRLVASIHYLESKPLDNPIKGSVASIAVTFLEAMAATVGCTRLSLENPLPELIEYYGAYGFRKKIIKGKRVVRLHKTIMPDTSNGEMV